MKRTIAIVLSAALCLGLLAGCGQQDAKESAGVSAGTPEVENLSGNVVTNGSTSMEKVMGALIEGFREKEPDVTVTYEPTGSGSGIEAAGNGSADIGLASRGLKDEEKTSLTETVVARDGIAIVVHPDNAVSDLSVEQVAAIAKGEITNWSELGGADAPVAFIGREAGSGTRGAFEELTDTEDACKYNQELTSTGAVITAVSTTPGGIGYASLSSVESSVKSLTIDGVACTEATVSDGSYPIQRPFVFATKTGEELTGAAKAFYDFALSEEAAPLYEAAGVVPAQG